MRPLGEMKWEERTEGMIPREVRIKRKSKTVA